MKITKQLTSLLKMADLFSTSQFLRYQEEGQYKTASGGFCSLVVMVMFIVLFINTAIQTIDMQIITWTSSTSILFDPVETSIPIKPSSNKFSFAVEITGVPLNDPTQRFFDISIIEHNYIRGGTEVSSTTTSMVPCTKEHFSVSSNIADMFDSLPTQKWLCPPLNYTMNLYGKYTSTAFKFLQLNVKKCNNTLDPLRPCASNTTITNLQNAFGGQFTFGFFNINPLINPGDQDYLNYYLEDRNYITFTDQLGTYSNGFVEDYTIDTDISLLPFTENIQDSGIIINQLFQNVPYQVTNQNLAGFYILKSSKSTNYQRSFNKLDTFFSYVGGLVGTILGFMLIVQKYTEMSFELDLSSRLFQFKENEPNNFDSFNILSYSYYIIYEILVFFGCKPKWESAKKYSQCRQEVIKQIDIEFILTRIAFLEKVSDVLLEENHLFGLHLQKQVTLSKIRKRRRNYRLNRKINVSKIHNQHSINENNSSQRDSQDQQHYSATYNENNSSVLLSVLGTMKNIEKIGEEREKGERSASQNEIQQKKRQKKKQQQQTMLLESLKKQSLEGNMISRKIMSAIPENYLKDKHKQLAHQQYELNMELNGIENNMGLHDGSLQLSHPISNNKQLKEITGGQFEFIE